MRLYIAVLLLVAALAGAPCSYAENPVVVFDEGHGQRFLIEREGDLDLSSLAGLFRKPGTEVKIWSGPLDSGFLSGVDVLVISGPFIPFSDEEIGEIVGFVRRGGRVALMVHVVPTLKGLLQAFGLDATSGAVTERENSLDDTGRDFSVTRIKQHPLTEGVGSFSVHGAWGLMPGQGNAETLASTSDKAWVDHDRDQRLGQGDEVGSFGLIVTGELGKGRFAVFGDDAIFQNIYLKDENRALGRNLADWLTR